MIADIAVSLLIGVLAGLGVGSGGLLIVYMNAFDHIDQLAAQGINLAVFVFALTAAVIVHLHRRDLSLPILGFVVVFGAAGAALGSLLATAAPVAFLRAALGVLLLFMGAVSLFRKSEK